MRQQYIVVYPGQIATDGVPPPLGERVTGVLDYKSAWAWQNDSSLNNFDGWVDGDPTGDTTDHPTNFDIKNMIEPHEVYWSFPKQLEAELHQIRLFDGAGGTIGRPVRIHAILDTGERIEDVVTPFHGEGTINHFNNWHTYQVPEQYKNVKYIIYEKTFGAVYPTEIEFTATYTPYNPVFPEIPKTKLGMQYGVNSFPWNTSGNYADINDPDAQELLSRYDFMHWHRDYFDAHLTDQIINGEHVYAYAPTHSGGWNQDIGYQRLKDKGIKTLRAVKNLPEYLRATYPQALDENGKQNADRSNRNGEYAYHQYKGNIVEYTTAFPADGTTSTLTYTLADGNTYEMFPFTSDQPTYFIERSTQYVYRWTGTAYVQLTENIPGVHFDIYTDEDATAENPIGKLKTLWNNQLTIDRNNPATYIDYARLAFQDVARYGNNPNVDPSLIKSTDGVVGLNLIHAWEWGNELNAFWMWRGRYISATEMAAGLSAMCDGHKGALGPGVGVKNADPNMLLANGGIVSANPRFFRAMLEWWAEHRGYLPNGDVDCPIDIIKYHQYTNSKGLEQHSGGSDRVGMPADMVPIATNKIAEIKQVFYEYCPAKGYMPVHIGENGYDEGPTTQSTPVIEGTTVFDINTLGIDNAITGWQRKRTDIRADWFVRDALEYAYWGCDSQETYLLEDPGGGGGPNPFGNVNLYASSGLSNRGDYLPDPRGPRSSMWFKRQLSKLFTDYTPTERLSIDPIVQLHEDSEGNIMYALWVPDMIGRVEEYTLSLPSASSVKRYTFADSSEDMNQEIIAIDGSITLQVTETPIFLEVVTVPVVEDEITVEVTFDTVPTTASSSFADWKYNKEGVFNYEQDDASRGIYHNLYPYLFGGIAEDGVTYPGKFFTDGCGNNVKATAAAATNSKGFDGQELHIEEGTTNIRYSDMAEIYNAGWSIENHGYGPPMSDRWLDLMSNVKNFYKRCKEYGAEIRTRVVIVPANDPEYVDTAFYTKHTVLSSQTTFDGFDDHHPVTPLAFIEANLSKLMLGRRLTESITTTQAEIWLDEFFESLDLGEKPILRCFQHNIQNSVGSFGVVRHIFDYLETNSVDRVWITTMQDAYEYLETKRDVIKNESLVDNKLTITLNTANISDLNRFRDMSLLVNADANITNVVVTGADSSSYNTATGLVNVFKEKTTFPDPALELPPPMILDARVEFGETNKVTIQYSKPVTQTILSAYEVTGKTITGFEGSGDTWKLLVTEAITSGEVLNLTYRMRLGDTADASDPTQLLNSYVNQSVRNRVDIAADVTAPTTPTNFRARKLTSHGYELVWDESTDDESVLGYNLETNGVWGYDVLTSPILVIKEDPEVTIAYRLRAIDINYNYSVPTTIVSVTTLALTDYQVLKKINIGFAGNETSLNSDGWNKVTGADWNIINTPSNDFKESDIYTGKLTTLTGIRLETLRAFTQSSTSQPTTGNNSGVFPDSALAGAWRSSDTSAGTDYLKITGLDPTKFYNFYLLGNVTGPDSNVRYTVGSISNDKAIYQNYAPAVNPDTPLEAESLSIHKGVASNASGEIIIYIEKLGPADWVAINGMVIEETNTQFN